MFGLGEGMAAAGELAACEPRAPAINGTGVYYLVCSSMVRGLGVSDEAAAAVAVLSHAATAGTFILLGLPALAAGVWSALRRLPRFHQGQRSNEVEAIGSRQPLGDCAAGQAGDRPPIARGTASAVEGGDHQVTQAILVLGRYGVHDGLLCEDDGDLCRCRAISPRRG
jgi:hypothetical protein